MGIVIQDTDNGEELTFDFKENAKGSDFNHFLRNIVSPGIYNGSGGLVVNGNDVDIEPYDVFINDQSNSDIALHISTTSNITITPTLAEPVIYMIFVWAEATDIFPSYGIRADGSPITNEIVFGKALFTGPTLTGVDTSIASTEGVTQQEVQTISDQVDTNVIDIATNTANIVPTPIGSIIAWHKSFANTPSLPSNYRECDGSLISDAESVYNGQTLPDLNGQFETYHSKGGFLRGDSSSGIFEDDKMQGHYTDVAIGNAGSDNPGITASGIATGTGSLPARNAFGRDPATDGTNGTPRTGLETNPINMSVVWIIRIK